MYIILFNMKKTILNLQAYWSILKSLITKQLIFFILSALQNNFQTMIAKKFFGYFLIGSSLVLKVKDFDFFQEVFELLKMFLHTKNKEKLVHLHLKCYHTYLLNYSNWRHEKKSIDYVYKNWNILILLWKINWFFFSLN